MLEDILDMMSWQSIGVIVSIYLSTVAFYRLYLHPLAKFPGPKIAAVSRWYEAYYDIVLEGQYEFRIQRMHDQYGPIVRISPYELHIRDSTYHEELYRFGDKWDRYGWQVEAHQIPNSTACTVDHEKHKERRAALNSYFSKARVGRHAGLIRSHISRLCGRLEGAAQLGVIFDVGGAFSAWQRDVSCDFILDEHPGNLDREDLGAGITTFIEGTAKIWRRSKHIRWYGRLIMSIPHSFLIKYSGDPGFVNWASYIAKLQAQIKRLMSASLQSSPDNKQDRSTIVHEIMWSRLPSEEKTFWRIFEEVTAVTGASFETTASVLRVIVYHVWSDAVMLGRLRVELADAIAAAASNETPTDVDNMSEAQPLSLRALERLPYLTGILMEGMRMSPGLGSRMQRVAPDRELVYKSWRIPAGTPVGMTQLDFHMDEEYYPQPRRFMPERWVDAKDRSRLERAYMPFSRGARNCLGMYFAWAELYLVVAELAQRFDFTFHDVADNHFEYDSDQFAVSMYGKSVLKATIKGLNQ